MDTALIIAGILQIVMIIVFLVMANNVAKIKKKLYQKSSFTKKDVIILREIGKTEEAYEMVMREFVDEFYVYKFGSEKGVKVHKTSAQKYIECFEILSKDFPKEYEDVFVE